jgi:anti-sigma B factor antagonist
MASLDGNYVRHGSGVDGQSRPPVTVRLAGEFDLAREAELVGAVLALELRAEDVVHLDVRDVTFVDSCGLRGMLAARSYLLGRGCRLELAHPTAQLRRLLQLSGIEELLPIAEG